MGTWLTSASGKPASFRSEMLSCVVLGIGVGLAAGAGWYWPVENAVDGALWNSIEGSWCALPLFLVLAVFPIGRGVTRFRRGEGRLRALGSLLLAPALLAGTLLGLSTARSGFERAAAGVVTESEPLFDAILDHRRTHGQWPETLADLPSAVLVPARVGSYRVVRQTDSSARPGRPEIVLEFLGTEFTVSPADPGVLSREYEEEASRFGHCHRVWVRYSPSEGYSKTWCM